MKYMKSMKFFFFVIPRRLPSCHSRAGGNPVFFFVFFCHSRESGNPVFFFFLFFVIPALAGMTPRPATMATPQTAAV